MPRLSPARCLPAVRLVPALLLLTALAGCGGNGLSRISGKVTFAGKPIPAGKIYFIPDGGKGNKGATGYADIKDGAYDTSAAGGMGAEKGPMLVAIEGFDPAAPEVVDKAAAPGEAPTKPPLFPRYQTAADLPGGTTTKDFDVPADATKMKPGATQITP